MKPEEKRVLAEARKLVRAYQRGRPIPRTPERGLMLAVQRMLISERPEEGPTMEHCSARSATGAMQCILPTGHDPDVKARRLHEGRGKDGARRRWWEWL